MTVNLLTPVLAMISWTLLVWLWMYALRIPAMQAANIEPNNAQHPGSLDVLPNPARQVADNYNHLHEQPTVFYALMFYMQLAGQADDFALMIAWVYVGLRIVHSLIQCTVNLVMARFGIFALSSIMLIVLTAKSVLAAI